MAHYYSKKQESPLKLNRFSAVLRGNNIEFNSGSGVFCKDKVDKGTMLLIKSAIIEDNWKVLDLGCGYGPVGIAIAKAYPSAKIIMSDVNKRAVMLSKMNIRLNNLKNAHAIQSDRFERITGKFNTILLNPPQSAGKDLCLEMIELSKNYLEKGGLFQMVARHNIGGKELEKRMLEVFGNVQELAKKSGYRIYISEKV